MGDDSKDPIDHARTTRQHAGETMKNGTNAPGLVILALGVMAMVFGLAAFASGAATAGSVAAIIAVFVDALWVIVFASYFLAVRRPPTGGLRVGSTVGTV